MEFDEATSENNNELYTLYDSMKKMYTDKGTEDYEFIFKVLLLGNSNVGKSSLFLRFVDDIWNDTFVPTIGVDFKIKTFNIDEKKIKMQIWDTAGQERFKNIIASYYRGAHGILLIYDVTDKESFKNLSNWLIEIEKNASKNVLKVLIGNKTDLEEKRVITYNQGKEFADSYGLKYIETSAKKNLNVNEAFETLGRELMQASDDKKIGKSKDKKISVTKAEDLNQEQKKGCC
jgi:Ras-related protein Rab-1A